MPYNRYGDMVGIIALEKICTLLDMQPGNIIKHVEDGAETNTLKKM